MLDTALQPSSEPPRFFSAVGGQSAIQHDTAQHILNGHWKLGQFIGQGSFGSVYTCMDEATGQLMAVKLMAIPTSEQQQPQSEMRSLCSEIELMRSFSHPNIVRYLGAAVDEAHLQLYIFQEWVPGGSLAALSKSYGAFAESVVKRYTIHILRGLEYLHKNHIIHRDIKCGNVLVDESGTAKLADFGASHRLGKDGTLTQDMKLATMRGTPFFMAPEVLKQDKFGRRSDVWSVGGVVLQMATTHPPWKLSNFKSPMALLYHVASTQEAPLVGPYNLSPKLERFILRCFERDPQRRPHAHELIRDPFLQDWRTVEEEQQLRDSQLQQSTEDDLSSGAGAAGTHHHHYDRNDGEKNHHENHHHNNNDDDETLRRLGRIAINQQQSHHHHHHHHHQRGAASSSSSSSTQQQQQQQHFQAYSTTTTAPRPHTASHQGHSPPTSPPYDDQQDLYEDEYDFRDDVDYRPPSRGGHHFDDARMRIRPEAMSR